MNAWDINEGNLDFIYALPTKINRLTHRPLSFLNGSGKREVGRHVVNCTRVGSVDNPRGEVDCQV